MSGCLLFWGTLDKSGPGWLSFILRASNLVPRDGGPRAIDCAVDGRGPRGPSGRGPRGGGRGGGRGPLLLAAPDGGILSPPLAEPGGGIGIFGGGEGGDVPRGPAAKRKQRE